MTTVLEYTSDIIVSKVVALSAIQETNERFVLNEGLY